MLVENNTSNYYYLGDSNYPLPPGGSVTVPDNVYNENRSVAKSINELDEDNKITVSNAPAGYPRDLSTGGGGSFSGDASDVVFTPAGTIAATNVQDAIEEVATESGSPGAAENVSFTPAGNIEADNVQDAIEELDTEKQAADTTLDTYAGIDPSANVQSVLGAADYAAIRTLLGLVIGTNVQAYDEDLDTYAGITPSDNVQSILSAADYAAIRTLLSVYSTTEVGTELANQKRVVEILVSDPNGSAITTGDGKAYFRVPSLLNGHNLVSVGMSVSTVSSSGIPTVQLRRVRSGSPVDMLSTKLTIDADESDSSTAANAAVINTSNDDVNTGDQIYIDIDVAGTGAKGLVVSMTFEAP